MSETSRIYVVGITPEQAARHAIERDGKRTRKGKRRAAAWLMNAYQRRTELQRLARYRHRNSDAMGSDAAWANVIGNVLRVINGHLTLEMVLDEWGAYGVPALDPAIVANTVDQLVGQVWGTPTLFSPRTVGSLLYLSSVERDEAGITKISACDETDDMRRLRLDRQRKAHKRAALAALAPKPETKKQMALRLGISRMELYRRIKAGTV